jgi:hypothetical protein
MKERTEWEKAKIIIVSIIITLNKKFCLLNIIKCIYKI